MKKAVFLDRDGVINELIYNPKTQEYESPHFVSDLLFIDGAIESMRRIQSYGFELFVISNQPSYAKGKTTLEEIKNIAKTLSKTLESNDINVREFFYCYHHPQGVTEGSGSEFTGVCDCRKPKPYFIKKAQAEYNLDIKNSWMIGDQDTDVECGQSAGCKTILIENKNSQARRGKSKPDFTVKNLKEAADILGKETK